MDQVISFVEAGDREGLTAGNSVSGIQYFHKGLEAITVHLGEGADGIHNVINKELSGFGLSRVCRSVLVFAG